MASGKEYKISFKLGADLESSFATIMGRAERDFKNLEKQIKDIGDIRLNGNVISGLQTEVQKLERDMRDIARIPGPNGYFTEMKTDIRSMAPELREIKKALEEISRVRMPGQMFGNDMDKYIRDIKELEDRMERLQRAGGPSPPGGGGGDPGGESGGGGIIALGSPALMAGAAAVGGAALMFSASEEYQRAMNQIQASTNITVEEMAGVKDVAKNLYNNNFGEDWGDLSQVISQVSQATGLTGKELESTTQNAIMLRDTFEFDTAGSIKAVSTMMKNFGITSDEAFTLLAQGAKSGLNTTDELLDTANEYSTYFSKLGFSAEGMFDTFAAGMDAGAFSLDKVGDGIKEFGIRAKDGSKASMEAYKSIGLSGEEMTDAFSAGGETAQEAFLKTAEAISAIQDPFIKNAASVQLFGTQAEDLETRVIDAYSNVESQFDSTANTLEDMNKIKYNTLGEAFKGIGRQIQTSFIIPLTEAVLPALSEFSGWFAGAIPKVKEFFGAMGGGPIGKFAEGIKEAGLNVQWLFENGFDGEMEGVAINYAKMLGMDDQAASEIAIKAKNMFNGISQDFANFRAWIGPTLAQIGKVAWNLITSVASGFGRIIQAMAPIVAYVAGKLGPIIAQVFGFIGNTVIPQLLAAWDYIAPKIGEVVGMVGPLMTAMFNAIKPVIDNIVATFEFAWPYVQIIVSEAINIIKGVVGGLLDALGGIITFITGVFSGNWSQAWNGIVQTFGGIWGGLVSMVEGPINAVIRMVNRAIESINSFKVDMPEILGGGTIGFNVGKIPEIGGGGDRSSGGSSWGNKSGGRMTGMQQFADGGFSNRAAIFGEAGLEAAIPIDNRKRSHDLLAQTNRMMGYDGGGDIHATFAPQIVIQGNADENAVNNAMSNGYQQFKGWMSQFNREQRRTRLT